MALTQVTGPYPIFTDLDGSPLDDGYLYIGAVNQDPETNPIQAYWDSNLTIPATQPIRTNNGYAWRNGTPGLIYTAGQFSITIRNKKNEFVLYSPVGYGFDPGAVSASVVKNDFTGDGIETDFTLSSAPSTILATNVFINGVYQEKDSYTLAGNVITFSIAPPLNSSIEILTNETGVINSGNATAISYTLTAPGAVAQTVQTKLDQYVSIFDFMTDAEKAAVQGNTFPTVNVTAAVQAAMNYWLDKFSGGANFYPGGPGQPYDVIFSEVDRRTGRIFFPSGTYLVSDQVFSSLIDPRSPFCGFEFVGEHRESSVLVLETNGVESWFYRNPASTSRYQKMLFRSLGFRSDDYRYGNFMTEWSDGGVKQMRFEHCDFQNLQKFLVTNGVGNADLTKVICCTGIFYGDILTLNNDQSVQHDFIGTDFGTYGNFIRVQAGGGGNVNVINSAIDFIWHTDFSPVGGNWMFLMDAGANVGIGNCTFAFRDCRVEIEAYTRGAGDPPFGLVNSYGNPQSALPRVLFENVNWVNGATYTIDVNGNITSFDYRKITAVRVFPRQNVEFKNCVLSKNFYYDVNGDNTNTSPNSGGIIKFVDCYDGVSTQLPSGESAKQNLHDRVTYSANAGRVITSGMTDQGTGSPFVRKALDVDPRWQYAFAREESSQKKILSFKPATEGFPQPANTTYDYYIDIPQIFYALRVYVFKPATGASANAYQLYLGNGDKSVTYATSTSVSGEFKDAHTIDVANLSLNGVGQLRLWAVGVGTDFQTGGIAYIEYI